MAHPPSPVTGAYLSPRACETIRSSLNRGIPPKRGRGGGASHRLLTCGPPLIQSLLPLLAEKEHAATRGEASRLLNMRAFIFAGPARVERIFDQVRGRQ